MKKKKDNCNEIYGGELMRNNESTIKGERRIQCETKIQQNERHITI